jgi:transposase-like protein
MLKQLAKILNTMIAARLAAKTGYFCKECGKSVVYKDGMPVRSCEHTGTIVAPMEAVARGVGQCDMAAKLR